MNDGHGGTAIGTATITVTGAVNHPPVANPDSYAAANNAVLTENAAGGVLANDTDPDGDTLTVDQLNGTGGPPRSPAPAPRARRSRSTPTDRSPTTPPVRPSSRRSRGARPRRTRSRTRQRRARWDGDRDVTITVTGVVNHPPVANPDSYTAETTRSRPTVAGGVLANDTDADADSSRSITNGAGQTPPFTAPAARARRSR